MLMLIVPAGALGVPLYHICPRASMEPDVRIELTTYRLQGGCSTTELIRQFFDDPSATAISIVPISGPDSNS